MKKNILIIAAILMAGFANAQSNKEEVDLLQAAVGMDKKEMVAGQFYKSPCSLRSKVTSGIFAFPDLLKIFLR